MIQEIDDSVCFYIQKKQNKNKTHSLCFCLHMHLTSCRNLDLDRKGLILKAPGNQILSVFRYRRRRRTPISSFQRIISSLELQRKLQQQVKVQKFAKLALGLEIRNVRRYQSCGYVATDSGQKAHQDGEGPRKKTEEKIALW